MSLSLSTLIQRLQWDDLEFKKILVAHIQNIRFTESSEQNKIQQIANLYCLDEPEYFLLEYYILKETTPLVSEMFKFIDSSTVEFHLFSQQVLKIKSWISLNKMEILLRKGILYYPTPLRRTAELKLSPNILEIFENSGIKTVTQIKNSLLGENQKSDLKLKDFKHLEKEKI